MKMTCLRYIPSETLTTVSSTRVIQHSNNRVIFNHINWVIISQCHPLHQHCFLHISSAFLSFLLLLLQLNFVFSGDGSFNIFQAQHVCIDQCIFDASPLYNLSVFSNATKIRIVLTSYGSIVIPPSTDNWQYLVVI